MFEQAKAIIQLIFTNPWQAILVLLLALFMYLTVRNIQKNERLKANLDEERSKFYIEIFSFLNMVLRNKVDFEDVDTLAKLSELDSKLKLFASDKVVKAWADFWKALFDGLGQDQFSDKHYASFSIVLEAYGFFQIAVRKDIGSSGVASDLKWYDFLRSVINDLDKLLEPSSDKFRSYDMKKYNKGSSDADEN